MKDEDYIGTGRDGAGGCEEPKSIIRGGVEFSTDSKTRLFEGGKHLFFGFLVTLVSFLITCFVLSFFDVHYVVKALTALIFSVLLIKAYDKATGEVPTPKTGAVVSFTIIFFVLCLFTGHQNDQGKSAGWFFDKMFFAEINKSPSINKTENDETFFSESGTVRLGEVWFPGKIFTGGSKVKIKVEYNAVLINGGRVLNPGLYEDEMLNSDGQIMFEGIAMNPSKITITY